MMDQSMVQVWFGLGAVTGTLMLVAAFLWASKTTGRQMRELWRVLRGYRGTLEAAVDDPADPFIRALAHLTRGSPALWSALLTGWLRAVADGLDAASDIAPDSSSGSARDGV